MILPVPVPSSSPCVSLLTGIYAISPFGLSAPGKWDVHFHRLYVLKSTPRPSSIEPHTVTPLYSRSKIPRLPVDPPGKVVVDPPYVQTQSSPQTRLFSKLRRKEKRNVVEYFTYSKGQMSTLLPLSLSTSVRKFRCGDYSSSRPRVWVGTD